MIFLCIIHKYLDWNPVRIRNRLTPTVRRTKTAITDMSHWVIRSGKALSEEDAESGYNTRRTRLWEEVHGYIHHPVYFVRILSRNYSSDFSRF